MTFEELVADLRDEDFHALTFKLDGKDCGMAGWWIAWTGEEEREYETREEMLDAELPLLRERFADMEDIDITTF